VVAQLVTLTLNHGVYVSRVVTVVSDALTTLTTWPPDLIVFDVAMPGSELPRRIRQRTDSLRLVPIIAITRRGDLPTKLSAFDQGVDDILTIPFSPEEFLARVLAVTRRASRTMPAFTPILRLGELEINILTRTVRAKGHDVALTPLDQSLLYLLAANAGRVIGRDEILDHLWGKDFAADSNVVDQHIRHLRAQLQDSWHRPRFIQTVHGQGYRFIPTIDHDQATSELT
jgi:two-component system alkaline phosphatase synthesis response regulator PhoP